jgi:hypothetical protein
MRKLIYNIIGFLTIAMLLLASGCTDNFENYNTPEDEPSKLPGPVAYGLALKDMQSRVLNAEKNKYQMDENLLGGAYGRYFASIQAGSKGWSMFVNFNPPLGWANSPFKNMMTDVYSGWFDIKNLSQGEGMPYAWAQIIRVAAMHRLTDIQGPIPYTQMGKNTGLATPYDSQKDAYMAMFEDLDAAITELTSFAASSGNDRTYATYDLVYKGDFAKWVKFANSLKLRMAMRISYVDPTNAEKYAKAALAHPYGVITSNEDNAAIDYSGSGDKNPLRWMVEEYQDAVAAAEIVTYMKSYEDPRLAVYFNKSSKNDEYAGLLVSAPSYLQWRESYSIPIVKAEDPLMWLSASEVAFLRAEMALKNWDAGGTAQEFYEQGITLSFVQNGLSVADAAAYYANSTLRPTSHTDALGESKYSYTPSTPYSVTIAWDEAAGEEVKLEKIITQKWIALYPLGTEAWCEQRRTGYPRFYPTVNNRSQESGLEKVGPSRLVFAPDEKEISEDNYNEAVRLLGGPDLYGTKLWWDVKSYKPAW